MVTPYYNDGVPSMISAFWKETPTRWYVGQLFVFGGQRTIQSSGADPRLGLVIAEIGYQVILIFFALVAYLPTVGSPRKWAKLYYVAIAGMLLEVVSVAVVR
ncbi:hypothetical protein BESB_066110 [Besnoitia besnoiti]|uniref:Uncharacterized protein n=1 Tax=Besnoitia besnoiti TaxID=94643 RepID=A0A2A9M7W4_BESBE|nr:hypothetical protein BESB_066110 [Besnoitia besnoiti]PFH34578.1 hypothetical protein BESB_066110 [Besnoitia besnoiti]